MPRLPGLWVGMTHVGNAVLNELTVQGEGRRRDLDRTVVVQRVGPFARFNLTTRKLIRRLLLYVARGATWVVRATWEIRA